MQCEPRKCKAELPLLLRMQGRFAVRPARNLTYNQPSSLSSLRPLSAVQPMKRLSIDPSIMSIDRSIV
jgi:hypothetical protein